MCILHPRLEIHVVYMAKDSEEQHGKPMAPTTPSTVFNDMIVEREWDILDKAGIQVIKEIRIWLLAQQNSYYFNSHSVVLFKKKFLGKLMTYPL